MTTMHDLQNQLTALVFRLSWGVQRSIQLAKDYTRHVGDPHGEGSSQTSSDDDVPEAETAIPEAEPAAANGDSAVEQSLSQQVLCSCLCPWLYMLWLVIKFNRTQLAYAGMHVSINCWYRIHSTGCEW